ncbi:MAG: hypothetical protein HYX38_08730 [Rhodospirillales bacterium]|nr:hypothetical protein [Rhodospirillales bacterium]
MNDAQLFTRCGHALCGDGPRWKEQFADLLGMKTNSVDNMSKGSSRIPPGVWKDIASKLHEREAALPSLKAAAVKLSREPLSRVYKVRNLEFRVRPAAGGKFPVVEYSREWPMGWWSALPDDARTLPPDTAAFRVTFDKVAGNPTVVGVDPMVHYPPNMALAP